MSKLVYKGKTALEYAMEACDTMMQKFAPEDLPPKGRFHYHQGVFLSGMEKTYELCEDEKYFNYIKGWVDSIIKEDGSIDTFDAGQLDDIQPGVLLFKLYEKTGDERYKIALDTLLPIIKNFKRNNVNNGFWHKEVHSEQMWLDGLYMAGPISCMYGKTFGDSYYFDESTFQAKLMAKVTKDDKTGLWYHAWDSVNQKPWADPATGRSPEFWGRSIGWVPVALLEELDYLPEDHKDREEIIKLTVELLEAVAKYQDTESGLWWQVVDKGGMEGNWLESSCTCLFVAALCKAVRAGLMDKKYLEVAQKGYEGIINRLGYNENGVIIDNICIGTGVGDYAHYCARPTSENDLHGVGSYLIMVTEVAKTL